MRRLGTAVVLFLLGIQGVPAWSEPGAAWEEALAACLAARDPGARRQWARRVRQGAPDVLAVAARLADAWTWPEDTLRGVPVLWERETPDGVVHTVYAHAPEAYTPDRAWPVLLYLHGNVTRQEDGGGQEGLDLFVEAAERDGFLLVAPSTQDGAHWWTPHGRRLVRGALRDLMNQYRVDADRVAVVGRSDGGTACFHLLAYDPDPYGCFVSLIGSPHVAEDMGGPLWEGNLSVRPVVAIAGGRDPVYPASRVAERLDALRDAGCRVTFGEALAAGHDLSFLPERWGEILAFWRANPRGDPPSAVTWTTSLAGVSRRAWIEVRALDAERATQDGIDAPEGEDVPHATPRPRLGLRLVPLDEGRGLRVDEVEEDTPAHEAGLEAGDVLLAVDGRVLHGDAPLEDLRRRTAAVGEGVLRLRVRRGDEVLEIPLRPDRTHPDAPPSPSARGYGVRPGTVRAEILGGNRVEVVTDGVGRLRLHLLPELLDCERELIVVLDGKEVYRGPVPLDLDHLLAEAHRVGPGTCVPVGFLDLDVTAGRALSPPASSSAR